MQTPTTALAAVVRSAVEATDLTRKQVADTLGLPKVTFHRKYHGHAPFTYPELVTLAGLLGTTVPDLHTAAEQTAA